MEYYTTNIEDAINEKEIIVLAVPSVFTRSTAKMMAPFVKEGQIIVCVAKGIEDKTLKPLAEVVSEEIPVAHVAVMCGPSHAEEVGAGLPTTLVAGAKEKAIDAYYDADFGDLTDINADEVYSAWTEDGDFEEHYY